MLNLSKLKQGVLDLSKHFPSSYEEAGRRLAQAYRDYAQEAVSIPGSHPVTLEPSTKLLATQLSICFATSIDLNVTSDRIANAFSTFWPAVVMDAVPPSGPGVCVPTGTAALSIGLKLLLHASDPDMAAQRISVLLDSFTHLVLVTHPNPTGAITMPLV